MKVESNNVEASTNVLPFAKRMLGEDYLPIEIQNYLNEYNIQFGKWYVHSKGGTPMQLTDFKFHPYWEDYILMFGKVGYRIALPFTWHEVQEPIKVVKESVFIEDERKEKDTNYYKLKTEHETLCKKKLDLHRQGKNTLMRNAYINQQLDVIREQLSKYK